MRVRTIVLWLVILVIVAGSIGAALVLLPRWWDTSGEAVVQPEPPAPATPRIRARLFYVSDDGMRLVSAEREIPFGETPVEQARRIVEAQIAPPPEPLVSPVPAGTKLRAVYISENGAAYVDLSREVSSAHPGGALNELLTVYAIVDAVTINLPAVTAVQILVDGRQADTLAGHVDLRRPLAKNLLWMREAGASPAAATPPAAAPPVAPGPGGEPLAR